MKHFYYYYFYLRLIHYNMDSGKPYGGILIGSNKNRITKHKIDNSLIECLLGG